MLTFSASPLVYLHEFSLVTSMSLISNEFLIFGGQGGQKIYLILFFESCY